MNKLEPQRCRSSRRCSRCNIFTCVIRTRLSARPLARFARIYTCKNTHPHAHTHVGHLFSSSLSRVCTCRHWSSSIRARPWMRPSFIAVVVLARAMKFTLAHRQECNIVAVTSIYTRATGGLCAGYGLPPRLIISKILRNRYISTRFTL